MHRWAKANSDRRGIWSRAKQNRRPEGRRSVSGRRPCQAGDRLQLAVALLDHHHRVEGVVGGLAVEIPVLDERLHRVPLPLELGVLARDLLEHLARDGKPGGRLVYWNMMTPRSRGEKIAHLLKPLTAEAQRLHDQDPAFFYSRLVIEEIQ